MVYPRADPIKGAVHGVAATVTNKPPKKERVNVFPGVTDNRVKPIPISKAPAKLRANVRKIRISTLTKIGDCIWNPHPT